MCGSQANQHKVLGKRLNQAQGLWPKRKLGITASVCKCKVCSLVFANPQPIPNSIETHYGVPPEGYWKPKYFQYDENYFLGEIKRLHTLMHVRTGMKSLDIGAGIGKQMMALHSAGFDAYGLEPSQGFYEAAVNRMKIPADKLKFSSIEEAEYEQEQFDFISFGAVLEHLYDPSAALVKALKWAKKGGIIHIEVPSSSWLTVRLANLFYKLTFSDHVGNLSPMHNPYHLYEFGLESFRLHAQKHGYEIAFYDYYVGDTYLPSIFNRLVIPYMKRTNQGMQLAIWLRKL
jgi:ubiquinone/menaquinone biosynthesis C-methylase UbiE